MNEKKRCGCCPACELIKDAVEFKWVKTEQDKERLVAANPCLGPLTYARAR